MSERICLKCGATVDDPSGFCPGCGTRVGEAAPRASQQSKKAWIAIGIGLAIAAGLFLLGRGATGDDGGTLDAGKIENEVERGIQRQAGETVRADCDENVPIESGRLSDCRVKDSTGATYNVRIRQDDDKGHITWELSP